MARRPKPICVGGYSASAVRARSDRQVQDGRWYWRIRHNGDSRWNGWATREEVHAEVLALYNAPHAAVERGSIGTVRDLLETWLYAYRRTVNPRTKRRPADSSVRNHKSRIRMLCADMGETPLKVLSPTDLHHHAEQSEASGRTLQHRFATLSAAWAWALREGHITRQMPALPALDLDPVRPTYQPTIDEVRACADWLRANQNLKQRNHDQVADMLLAQWWTGCRISELWAITPEDVIGDILIIRDGKTGARRVPLLGDALPILVARAATHAPGKRLWTYGTAGYATQVLNKKLRKAQAALGQPRWTTHKLRGGGENDRIRDGVEVTALASMYGHTVRTMSERYRQVSDDELRKVADVVAKAQAREREEG